MKLMGWQQSNEGKEVKSLPVGGLVNVLEDTTSCDDMEQGRHGWSGPLV